jgi:hypothetical protein
VSPTGQVLQTVVLKRSLTKAAEHFGWKDNDS